MNNLFKNLILTAMVFSASACSLRDRNHGPQVSVTLPSDWVAAVATKKYSTMATTSTSTFTAPTSINDLNCFAINVKGPGIQPDSRFGCTDPTKGPSQVAGFVPVTQSRMDVMVPAGAGRVIQLIGVQSTIGCPDLNTVLSSSGSESFRGALGEPYLLGEATIDVFDDTAVSIVARLDTTKKAFDGCESQSSSTGTGTTVGGGSSGSGSGGSTGTTGPMLGFEQRGGVAKVQQGHCSPIFLYSNNYTSTSIPQPYVKVSSNVTTGLSIWTDPTCSQAAHTTPVPLPTPTGSYTNPGIQFYVKSEVTDFTLNAEISNSAAGWSPATANYSTVQNRLGMVGPNYNLLKGNCVPFTISQYDTAGTTASGSILPNGSTLFFSLMNNTSTTAPATRLYHDNGCATELTVINTTANRREYSLAGPIGASERIVFAKTDSNERAYLVVGRNPSDAETVGAGFEFGSPPVIVATSLTAAAGTAMNFSVPVSGTAYNCSLVTAQSGFTASYNYGAGSCQISMDATVVAGTYTIPISASNNFGSSSASVTIEVTGTTQTVGAFQAPSAYSCATCTTSGNVYSITANTSIAMNPLTTSGTVSSCTVSAGTMPSGLYLDPTSCIISGTAISSGTYSVTVTGSVAGTSTSAALTLVIDSRELKIENILSQSYLQQGNCSKITVVAKKLATDTGFPSVYLVASDTASNLSADALIQFYSDSSCSNLITTSNPVSMPAISGNTSRLELYGKVTPITAGVDLVSRTFIAMPMTSASGWVNTGLQLQISSKRLIANTISTITSSCQKLELLQKQTTGEYVSLAGSSMSISMSNMTGTALSSRIYSDASCQTQLPSSTYTDNGWIREQYNLNPPAVDAAGVATYYLKSYNPESGMISVAKDSTDATQTAEPIRVMYQVGATQGSSGVTLNLSGVPAVTSNTSPKQTFSWTSIAGVSYRCRYDSSIYTDCTAPYETKFPLDGSSHTVVVSATDGSGITNWSTHSWTQANKNTLALLHLESLSLPSDSSSIGNTFTYSGNGSLTLGISLTNFSYGINMTNKYIAHTNPNATFESMNDVVSSISIETLVQSARSISPGQYITLVSKGVTEDNGANVHNTNGWELRLVNKATSSTSNYSISFHYKAGNNAICQVTTNSSYSFTNKTHIAVVFNAGNTKIFLDGSSLNTNGVTNSSTNGVTCSNADNTILVKNGSLLVGANSISKQSLDASSTQNPYALNPSNLFIDELRISRTPRTYSGLPTGPYTDD